MKRSAIFLSLIAICLTVAGTAFGQKGCEFKIAGTWKADIPEDAKTWGAIIKPLQYRFAPEGTVTVLSSTRYGQGSELREIGRATYTLDDLKAPKRISFTTPEGVGAIAQGTTLLEITGYDDQSFTFVRPGYGPTRLVRIDAFNYYLVLAGRSGTFHDGSGPTFPMVIKMDGGRAQIDAVGIYSAGGKWVFGSIPAETYNEFMEEPRKDSDVMLRLKITEAQYERSLKIIRTWERRAREGTLLYPDIELSNILLVKQVTEGLNQCGEKIKLYNLDWGVNDHISEITAKNPASRAPFMYFKELRRLNEPLHVRDEQFHGNKPSKQPTGR